MRILTVVKTGEVCRKLYGFITNCSSDHFSNTVRVISNYIQFCGSEKWPITHFHISLKRGTLSFIIRMNACFQSKPFTFIHLCCVIHPQNRMGLQLFTPAGGIFVSHQYFHYWIYQKTNLCKISTKYHHWL